MEALGDPSLCGVEIVNLAGRIEKDKDNIALNLKEWLQEDNRLKRFSMISLDADVRQNVKTIRALTDLVVGSIFPHEPDFEFANFTLRELVHIATELEIVEGFDSDALRNADWTGIDTGKAFENRYLAVSNRGRTLNGEKWGRALVLDRPFTVSLRHAALAQSSNYDHHKDSFIIDRNTFRPNHEKVPSRSSRIYQAL